MEVPGRVPREKIRYSSPNDKFTRRSNVTLVRKVERKVEDFCLIRLKRQEISCFLDIDRQAFLFSFLWFFSLNYYVVSLNYTVNNRTVYSKVKLYHIRIRTKDRVSRIEQNI